MKTDLYTKTILTIIAFCLVVNIVKEVDLIPSAYALDPIENPNMIESNVMDVRIVDINTYDELNVNLNGVSTSEELKVNLKRIETTDELDVNLDEIGGGWVNHSGPIPVKIQ